MNRLDLKKELGLNIFQDFISQTGLSHIHQKSFIIYPEYFKKNTETLLKTNRDLYMLIKKNILDKIFFKQVKEILIEV